MHGENEMGFGLVWAERDRGGGVGEKWGSGGRGWGRGLIKEGGAGSEFMWVCDGSTWWGWR